VNDIFVLQWKKQRLESYNQILLNQRVVQAHTDNEANRHGKILKGLAPEFSKATSVEAVEQIFSLLSPVYVEVITSWVPRDKCKDPTKWGQAIGKVLSDLKPEILQDPGLFATIVNPDLMDIELSRSLRLDEAIDRKIKRLMQVKTAKQIFPSMTKTANSEPKLINPPRDADRQSARITEDEQYPATHAEIAIVPESDGGEDRFERKYDPDVKGTLIIEGDSDLSRPNMMEKEHPDPEHAKVEILAKPLPGTLREMRDFSVLYDRLCERDGWARVGLARCL
jgi:hypothetical protein